MKSKTSSTKPDYAAMVDRLGIIYREAQALAEEDNRLRKALKKAFKPGIIEGTELFDATVGTREIREPNVDHLYRFLMPKDFLKVASVSLEKLQTVLNEEQMSKFVIYIGTKKTITVRPKAAFREGKK